MKAMKHSSTWMAVLTFTAVVLGAILLSSNSQKAEGAMIIDQTGFSLLTSGNGGDESLIIIDKTRLKMIAYKLSANGAFDVVGAMNLR